MPLRKALFGVPDFFSSPAPSSLSIRAHPNAPDMQKRKGELSKALQDRRGPNVSKGREKKKESKQGQAAEGVMLHCKDGLIERESFFWLQDVPWK